MRVEALQGKVKEAQLRQRLARLAEDPAAGTHRALGGADLRAVIAELKTLGFEVKPKGMPEDDGAVKAIGTIGDVLKVLSDGGIIDGLIERVGGQQRRALPPAQAAQDQMAALLATLSAQPPAVASGTLTNMLTASVVYLLTSAEPDQLPGIVTSTLGVQAQTAPLAAWLIAPERRAWLVSTVGYMRAAQHGETASAVAAVREPAPAPLEASEDGDPGVPTLEALPGGTASATVWANYLAHECASRDPEQAASWLLAHRDDNAQFSELLPKLAAIPDRMLGALPGILRKADGWEALADFLEREPDWTRATVRELRRLFKEEASA